MADQLTDQQWQEFNEQGFLPLGRVLDDEQLAAMQQRIDDIMLGTAEIDYEKVMMQLDADSDDYSKLSPQTKGHKGATLDYRKIQDLEYDPMYLEYMQRPLFKDICERAYGKGHQVRCFRAMFMNKPAGKGTYLPWHQDRWTYLDRDPKITIWLALDPVTVENGAVQIIPGTHKKLRNPEHSSGFLTKQMIEDLDKSNARYVELEAGEAVILHNWTLHSSDRNTSKIARRAFSTCYMDGETKVTVDGAHSWNTLFGEGAMTVDDLQSAKA